MTTQVHHLQSNFVFPERKPASNSIPSPDEDIKSIISKNNLENLSNQNFFGDLHQDSSFQKYSTNDYMHSTSVSISSPSSSDMALQPQQDENNFTNPSNKALHTSSPAVLKTRNSHQVLSPSPSIAHTKTRSQSMQHSRSSFGKPFNSGSFLSPTFSIDSPPITIESLIQLDLQKSITSSKSLESRSSLAQIIIKQSILNRLDASLQLFYSIISQKFVSDPTKFVSPYLQATELSSSILNTDPLIVESSGFISSLKSSAQEAINSFIGLIKTSPKFFCACISSMSESEINSLFESSLNTIEDLPSLQHFSPLDIIFYSFFSPLAPLTQRYDYFSVITAFAFDHDEEISKYHKLICAIFDRVAHFYTQELFGFEEILLGILQEGQFLLKNTSKYSFASASQSSQTGLHSSSSSSSSTSNLPTTPIATSSPTFSLLPSSSSSSSTPTSLFSSPELTAVSSPAVITATFSTSKQTPATASLQKASSSLRHHKAKSSNYDNANKAHSSSQSSTSYAEFEAKKTKFLSSFITRIITHLNNTVNESIPTELKKFISLTLSKVSEESRENALNFIFYDYFVGKYLYKLLVYPESFGLLHDFFVSENQRQKILLLVFQYLKEYINTVIFGSTAAFSNSTIQSTLKSQIIQLYHQFAILKKPNSPHYSHSHSNSNDDFNITSTQPPGSPGSFSNFDESFINYPFDEDVFTGQILVLSPTDIITLYNSLFPIYPLTRKQAASNPINVDKPSSASAIVSSVDSLCHSSDSTSGKPFYFQKTSSTKSLPASRSKTPSFDDLSIGFNHNQPAFELDEGDTDDYDDDYPYLWNLLSIKKDLEPAIKELHSKFPYLQSKSSSSSQNPSNTQRSQKMQSSRPYHTITEKWQIFQIDKENIVQDVDENSLVNLADSSAKNPDVSSSLFGGFDTSDDSITNPLQFTDPEKPPQVSSGNSMYFDVVITALDLVISENSSKIFNSHSNNNDSLNDDFDSNPPLAFDSISLHSQATSVSQPQSRWTGDFRKIPNLVNINVSLPFSSRHKAFNSYYLLQVLTDAADKATSSRNYYKGSQLFNASQALIKLLPPATSSNFTQQSSEINQYILKKLKKSKETEIQKILTVISKCENLAGPYQIYLQRNINQCETLLLHLNELRTKVWYATEVRSTPLWSRAKDVAISLRDEARGKNNSSNKGSLHALKRNSSTNSLASMSSFSLKRFTSSASSNSKRDYNNKRHSMSHLFSSETSTSPGANCGNSNYISLFASDECAGKKKLNDKESESTERWLKDRQIQNFCTGEELIHRFFCELEDLSKRVIGHALLPTMAGGQRPMSPSILTSSVLFRHDLFRLLVDLDGWEMNMSNYNVANLNRSGSNGFLFSSPSHNNPGNSNTGGGGIKASLSMATLSSSLNHWNSSRTDLDSDSLNRRGSIESVPMDMYRGSSRSKPTSSQNDLSKSYSLRSHKSGKSNSPYFLEMFTSSLDFGGYKKSTSSSDANLSISSDYSFDNGVGSIPRPNSAASDHLGHRRNRSFNEAITGTRSISEDVREKNINASRMDLFASNYFDKNQQLAHQRSRDELKQLVLNIQMRLISLLYSDLGMECWSDGSETDKWLLSPIVTESIACVEKSNITNNNDVSNPKDLKLSIPLSETNGITSRRQSSIGPRLKEIELQDSYVSPSNFKTQFPYEEAYGNLIYKLSVSPSPMTKLVTIHELVKLVVSHIQIEGIKNSSVCYNNNNSSSLINNNNNNNSTTFNTGHMSNMPSISSDSQFATVTTPRTSFINNNNANNNNNNNIPVDSGTTISRTLSRKSSISALTSLSEAIATVEAKRVSSGTYSLQSPLNNGGVNNAVAATNSILNNNANNNTNNINNNNNNNGTHTRNHSLINSTLNTDAAAVAAMTSFGRFVPDGLYCPIANTDAITEELRRIFKTKGYHSHTLFRDLQQIAAFVPSHVLDLTDMGKSFWDVSSAALSIKQDSLTSIVQAAYEIFKYRTEMISGSSSTFSEGNNNENSSRVFDEEFLSKWTLEDCAKLWVIAAREGDIDGQRELAIMYMSHPQIVPLVLPPLTKTSDVFSQQQLEDYRSFYDSEKKVDPIRMAIVKYWMTNAAELGDDIACEYLQQQQSFSGHLF